VLAIVIAVVANIVLRGAKRTHRFVSSRPMIWSLTAVGLIIAGLAIGFSLATGKSAAEVAFDGQNNSPDWLRRPVRGRSQHWRC
jgi:hypothetical protein